MLYNSLILPYITYCNLVWATVTAQWARMKPNRAKTVFILNFAADSSGALKCRFFYLLCSPYTIGLTMKC